MSAQLIQDYLNNANRLLQTGHAREHSYRGDLQQLLNNIINDEKIIVINEPARIRNVGAPDYSISKNNIPIGYIEAKDIDKPLNSKEYKEQFNRYKNALPNLIITDYLNFIFYKNGRETITISIAKIEDETIIPLEDNFNLFINNIKDFTSYISQTITSPLNLAKLMAGKARLLEDVLEKAILSDDEENEADLSLKNQMEIFKENLIHDIKPKEFADVYAQTIAYGMFVARLHDKTLENFSRQEAVFLIPKTNPFLRGLFSYISGVQCDDRLIWIIDSLAEIFLATDIKKLLNGFGQKTGQDDPIIHFYETFLGEYNPKLRKSRGVWYTPEPVVKFIVRACDEVLKNEFGIEDGLTDESKLKIKSESPTVLYTKDGKKKKDQTIEKEVHKIQILDPATGTGTFLAETIKFIKKDFFGSWSSYVEEHLIPRLNGFELLMASYAMAHLKLDLLLLETGYKPINQKRFNVFLTNSLEEATLTQNNLFQWYARESLEASRVKKDTPVMVVMGNPPYSNKSSNKGAWIRNLIKDYKKDLNEKKINLDDDYIKFIRYGQHYIEKNGEGILAYISNNSFLDGITHRQMRKSLLETFDKIYILDLHGSNKKKETAPDGSADENVFDIMQGVSINIFIKKSKNKKLADVFHTDLFGKRDFKYSFLGDNSLKSMKWKKLNYKEPYYFFTPKDFRNELSYSKGIKISDLFLVNNSGVKTDRDSLFIGLTKEEISTRIKSLLSFQYSDEFEKQYRVFDSGSYKIIKRINKKSFNEKYIEKVSYRPFDTRYMYYDSTIISRPASTVMPSMLKDENIGLSTCRQQSTFDFQHILVTNTIADICYLSSQTKETGYVFPLYLYTDESSLERGRTPNLNLEIIEEIERKLSIKFTPEKEDTKITFAPIDILDYTYATLHSPKYRNEYKEFLKIDFPKVPYPDSKTFWGFVELGRELRTLHLMENDKLNERIIDIDGEGRMEITNKLNKVDVTIKNNLVTLRLNANVSITNIPLVAWEFYIGGYQPAQKWLKGRVGKELSRTDIKHYNKIINALVSTNEIMKKIDTI